MTYIRIDRGFELADQWKNVPIEELALCTKTIDSLKSVSIITLGDLEHARSTTGLVALLGISEDREYIIETAIMDWLIDNSDKWGKPGEPYPPPPCR